MLCRNRWGGLEQEGFGIVFVEAAAAGTPQVAGDSGGASEAVADGQTGVVVDADATISDITSTISELLANPERRFEMGAASRQRATTEFSYDVLAMKLQSTLDEWAAL